MKKPNPQQIDLEIDGYQSKLNGESCFETQDLPCSANRIWEQGKAVQVPTIDSYSYSQSFRRPSINSVLWFPYSTRDRPIQRMGIPGNGLFRRAIRAQRLGLGRSRKYLRCRCAELCCWQDVWERHFPQYLGSQGSGPGQFKNPIGIAVDNAGNIYVTDSVNSNVQKFSILAPS